MKKILLGLAVVITGAAAASWNIVEAPYQGFKEPVRVVIERGTGTRAIAEKLAKAGVVRAPWVFMAARALDSKVNLLAGEYEFTKAASARDVLSRLAKGDVYHFAFTIPEGSNMFDIAKLVEEHKLGSANAFLTAARDPALIRDLDPTAKTLEGYLFPSTYQLTSGVAVAGLVEMMTKEFRKQWARLGEGNPHDALTLASLVEKETGVAEERKLVASVFANRLKKSMRLGCDPTVIYASLLAGKYNGVIHRSDLDRVSPYNTYTSDGLPPGPIASPGAASIEAALHPAETQFLYFVAKPEGGSHRFTTNAAAHDKAVAAYRHASQGKGH